MSNKQANMGGERVRMAVPDDVKRLIERFDKNADSYRSKNYNETRLRVEFLDPLFKALGWDVRNEKGYAEAYKDVIHEDAINIGGATKAPDYCFRIGSERKFFLEAKKPAVNIKEDASPAYQLRRYAWSAKLPLSVLSDFDEFATYDCRVKPVEGDKPSTARILYIAYLEYEDRWEEIYSIFSKQAVLEGSFDKYAETSKKKKGTAEVDEAFLSDIESWRDMLARNLALRNPSLSQRELNYSVQVTIDRIIFLRICEDRGIETYGQLLGLTNGAGIYPRLLQVFQRADDRYNSGLFHFQQEKGRIETPDTLTPKLFIDDKVLASIIKSLYYPNSPYEFSVLPATILGHVYEQFLGKVIRLTAGHQAKVEDKPEVKKAGGVYYTPDYIVEYIVDHTVGKLLEGKTPKQAAKLKILDPACGSGSFLIGAYQKLLDWHRDWYIENEPEKRKELYQGRGGEWKLTIAERKRILLNSIYGVDIDPQAVEVTKLSLLLKVLEGESEQTLSNQMQLFQQRALPDLSDNIKCGNSLIGPDFYSNQQMNLYDENERYRINSFNWEQEFSSIIEVGGFDAVIGNPPYLNIDDTWGKGDERLRYIKESYSDVYNDKTDILFYFLVKAVQLSKIYVGLIVSRAFLEAYKANKLRAWLSSSSRVTEIVDFQNLYVFKGVGITTAIVILDKSRRAEEAAFYKLRQPDCFPYSLAEQKQQNETFSHVQVPNSDFGAAPWIFPEHGIRDVNEKIDAHGEALGDILFVGQGMQTGCNNVFGKLSKSDIERMGFAKGQYYIRARNSDIRRYAIRNSSEYIMFLESFNDFDELPTNVRKHLKDHEDELKNRAAYKRGNCLWWKYTWPLHKSKIKSDKLMCPYLSTSNRFALDDREKYLGLTDTTIMYENGQPEQLAYIACLLNSKLLDFRFRHIGKLKSGGIYEYFWNSISKIPIVRIDFSNKHQREKHEQAIMLYQQVTTLVNQLELSTTPHDKELLQRQIDTTDRQIDQLVYELYELTPEEIKIVEGNS